MGFKLLYPKETRIITARLDLRIAGSIFEKRAVIARYFSSDSGSTSAVSASGTRGAGYMDDILRHHYPSAAQRLVKVDTEVTEIACFQKTTHNVRIDNILHRRESCRA